MQHNLPHRLLHPLCSQRHSRGGGPPQFCRVRVAFGGTVNVQQVGLRVGEQFIGVFGDMFGDTGALFVVEVRPGAAESE